MLLYIFLFLLNLIINDLKLKDRIVARLYDGEEYSQYATCVISDNKKPVISIETTEVTTKSIKIKANAIDNESGLADDSHTNIILRNH